MCHSSNTASLYHTGEEKERERGQGSVFNEARQ